MSRRIRVYSASGGAGSGPAKVITIKVAPTQ